MSKMTWFEILKVKKPDFLDLDGDGNKKEPMSEAADDAKKANGMSARGFRGGDRRKPRRGTTLEGGSLQDKKTKCLEEWEKHRSLAKYEECMEKAKR